MAVILLIRRGEHAEVRPTVAGIECFLATGAGGMIARQADAPWLVRVFAGHGILLVERRTWQFTAVSMLLGSRPLRRVVHSFNNHWLRFPPQPGLAYGNLLVFRRMSR